MKKIVPAFIEENKKFIPNSNEKEFEEIDGKIEIGDLFYLGFCDRVEIYKDVDYGYFDPNNLGSVKVREILK
jgi:hypothetical protein